jgi:hypothetical protein
MGTSVMYLRVRGMMPEEFILRRARLADASSLRDVLLAPVHDADVPQPQRHDLVAEIRARVRAAVHDVELGDDADGAFAVGVDGARQRERV